jgi:hypothetical protein
LKIHGFIATFCSFTQIFFMKKILTFLSILLFSAAATNAQIFWTENFESGSPSGMLVNLYTGGPNGPWTMSVTGTEGSEPNAWYVSCTEAGHTAGNCGSTCTSAGPTGTGASLHVGSSPAILGDLGASYFSGGLCYYYYSYSYGTCVTTDRRAESPTINCTGKAGISLKFNYIENGDGTTDDGSVWYYNGTTWSLLENCPKTPVCGSGQGQWATRTIALPSSADGNPSVKIGFRWVNNDDGAGTDPSFAIDSMRLIATPALPVASFTTSRDTACQDSCITFTNTTTGAVDSFRWSIVGTPYSVSNISPLPICFTSTVVPAGVYVVRLDAFKSGGFDSATYTIVVKPAPHPVITKTGHVLSIPASYTNYQWYNGATAISGATNNSYTYTTPGLYSVRVDSAGCRGTSVFSTLGITSVNNMGNFWVSQDNNTINVHASQLLTESLTVTVTDQMGRQLASELWERGKTIKEINGASLAPGIYFIKLSNGGTSSVLKLMKD